MYQLITDSGCDLPFQTLQAHHVAFVSMHFNLDGQEITDDLGQSYDINDCFEKIAAGVMPTTTQVNVGEF
jgi:fatty acid-binding protein DegV